jgi:hypothetical protein
MKTLLFLLLIITQTIPQTWENTTNDNGNPFFYYNTDSVYTEIPKINYPLQAYPNPFNDSITFSWQQFIAPYHASIKVFDILGNLKTEVEYTDEWINVISLTMAANFPTGIYIVVFKSELLQGNEVNDYALEWMQDWFIWGGGGKTVYTDVIRITCVR